MEIREYFLFEENHFYDHSACVEVVTSENQFKQMLKERLSCGAEKAKTLWQPYTRRASVVERDRHLIRLLGVISLMEVVKLGSDTGSELRLMHSKKVS